MVYLVDRRRAFFFLPSLYSVSFWMVLRFYLPLFDFFPRRNEVWSKSCPYPPNDLYLPNELGLLVPVFLSGNLFVVDWFCVSAIKEIFYIIFPTYSREASYFRRFLIFRQV